MSFQQRLKAARKAKGLNQEQLSEIAGYTQSMICQYEVGSRLPSVRKVMVLAKALDVESSHLFGTIEDWK